MSDSYTGTCWRIEPHSERRTQSLAFLGLDEKILSRNKVQEQANNKSSWLDVAVAPLGQGSKELVYGVGLIPDAHRCRQIYHPAQDVSEVHFVVNHYRCEGKWRKGPDLTESDPGL